MQYLNTQQLSSYTADTKKFGSIFMLFDADDIRRFSEYRFIGSRAIIFVCCGTLEIFINGNRHVLGEGNYSDIMDGTMFYFGEVSPDAEAYCIFTTKSFMLDSLQGVMPERENYLFRILSNPVLSFVNSRRKNYIVLQLRLLCSILSDTLHRHREDMVKLYFKALTLELSDALASQKKESFDLRRIGKREILIASFIDLVWKHLKDTREVSFYARELCITHKHLSRVVKEITGKTPHEIIAGETLAMAVQLLQNNNLLIQQVADILHFSDQAAFSKFFKKYVGMSPVEYRKVYYDNPADAGGR